MKKKIPIAIAKGDGIGPEIMDSVLYLLAAVEAPLTYQEVVIGEKVYSKECPTGIPEEAYQILKNSRAFLKAPVTTPQGKGFKSVTVQIRSYFHLYANIRPAESFFPFVKTKYPDLDIIIVRENEEDLYCGLEYKQSPEVTHAIKIISSPGCQKIIHFAFQLAEHLKRKKVTCITKDNILKLTDGLFHETFIQVASTYNSVLYDHFLVDIGAAKLASSPEIFDVMVMPNLYGDIFSDISGELSGSIGLAGAANMGDNFAMFEAQHGSAIDIAGKNLANPSGLLRSAILMLLYLGQNTQAELLHNAWLTTLEKGIHTADIFDYEYSTKKVSTKAFTKEIAQNLGKKPKRLKKASYPSIPLFSISYEKAAVSLKVLKGADIYIAEKRALSQFFSLVHSVKIAHLELTAIFNRGAKLWPGNVIDPFCTDQYLLRFEGLSEIPFSSLVELLKQLEQKGFEIIRMETLYEWERKRGYF